MNFKIVIITSHYLHKKIEEICSSLKTDCTIQVAPYDNFSSIPKVYDAYANDADGFLVSGSIAKAAIEAVRHDLQRPILSFEIDNAGLCRAILNLLLENRNLDMNRVILDFLISIDGASTANAFLQGLNANTMPHHISNWMQSLTAVDIKRIEEQTLCEIARLWRANEIELVLCQYSNIIPTLEEKNIPYIYPLPSIEHLKHLINSLLSKIELEYMRAKLPVIINAAPRDSKFATAENIHLLKIGLQEFFHSNLIDCIPQEAEGHCNTLLTVEVMRHITQKGRSCMLSIFLAKKLGYEISVGYGVGANFDAATKNSYTARQEAAFTGSSFIQIENGDLIGPLNSNNRMVIENHFAQDIGKIAKKSKLSTITIKKVITSMKINNSNKITTPALAERLGGTVRNANRILQNLEKSGFAKIAYTQTNNSKGRPTKVYELDFKL